MQLDQPTVADVVARLRCVEGQIGGIIRAQGSWRCGMTTTRVPLSSGPSLRR
jgi:hypothetical protein